MMNGKITKINLIKDKNKLKKKRNNNTKPKSRQASTKLAIAKV